MSAIRIFRALLLLLVAVVAAGQSSVVPLPSPASEPAPYRIGPGDVLQVDVWKEPDASVSAATVRPDGKISIPLVGEVRVAGLMPVELETDLAGKYRDLIRSTHVTVTIREINSQKVYVIGEVRREGPIKMSAPLTVLQALAEGGGITEYAKRKNIRILRMVNGRQVTFPFNYAAVVHGQNVHQNILLLPNDTIVVPR